MGVWFCFLKNKLNKKQNNGRGLEYSFGLAVSKALSIKVGGDSAGLRKAAYEGLDADTRALFDNDAAALLEHVLSIEGITKGDLGWKARFLDDSCARDGDVRDIVLSLGKREVGISCKSNHRAFKHSRISPESAFTRAWGLTSDTRSSASYRDDLRRLFDGVEKGGPESWSDLEASRKLRFYDDCIRSFERELSRLFRTKNGPKVCLAILRYFLGKYGYYKCVVSRSGSFVQAYSFGRSPVPRISFPRRLIAVHFPPGRYGVLHLYFDRGFSFSLRLHNASRRYERSLKFDIQALGLPQSLYSHHLKRCPRR